METLLAGNLRSEGKLTLHPRFRSVLTRVPTTSGERRLHFNAPVILNARLPADYIFARPNRRSIALSQASPV